jgi:D-alanyl-D-alanine carboxypeptidase
MESNRSMKHRIVEKQTPMRLIRPIVFLLVGALALSGCGSTTPTSWDRDSVVAEIDTLLEGHVRTSPSGDVDRHAMVYVDAPTVSFNYAGAAGIARVDTGEPMSADHQYYIASVAKAFTAVVIYQLAEEGAFGEAGIDATLAELAVLAPEVMAELHRIDGVSYADSITLRHLLNHTSGLRDLYFDGVDTPVSLMPGTVEGAAPDSLIGTVASDNELGIAALVRCTMEGMPEGCDPDDYLFRQQWLPWDYQAWKADRHDRMAGLLNFYLAGMNENALWEPGEGFHYSDTNYVLLGLVVEELAGNSLHREVHDRILDPLGMDDTDLIGAPYRPTEVYGRRLAEVWAWNEPAVSGGLDFSFDWGGGGAVSTLEDLARFVRALVAGDLFRDPATLDEMLAVPEGIRGLHYASGFIVFPTGEGPVVHMMGSTGTWAEYYPPLDLVTIGTVDDADNLPGEFMLHIELYALLAAHGLDTPMAKMSSLPMLLALLCLALLAPLSLSWLIVAVVERLRKDFVAHPVRLARWLATGVLLANLLTIALTVMALGENQFQMLFGFSPQLRQLFTGSALLTGTLALGLIALAAVEWRRREGRRLQRFLLWATATVASLSSASFAMLG